MPGTRNFAVGRVRKAAALRKWEKVNPDRLKYEMIFAHGETVGYEQLRPVREFVE